MNAREIALSVIHGRNLILAGLVARLNNQPDTSRALEVRFSVLWANLPLEIRRYESPERYLHAPIRHRIDREGILAQAQRPEIRRLLASGGTP